MQVDKYCTLLLTIFMQATEQSENDTHKHVFQDDQNDEKSPYLRSSHCYLFLAFIKTTHL